MGLVLHVYGVVQLCPNPLDLVLKLLQVQCANLDLVCGLVLRKYCDRVVIFLVISYKNSISKYAIHRYIKLRHSRSTPPHNPNLRTELAGVLKLSQVGLDKAEQLHTSEREKTQPFYLLKWVWAKLNNTFHGHLFILCSLSVWR